MFRLLSRLVLLFGVVGVLLVGLAVAYWSYLESANSGALPNGIAYTRYTLETTRPLTVDDARKHWYGFAFPDSATNIHIAAYHEWQAAVQYVRFEAPVEDCLATARAILQAHNAKEPGRPVDDLADELYRHRMRPPLAPLTAPWFTPDTIRIGKAAVGDGEYSPEVWVDLERGILYFHRSQ